MWNTDKGTLLDKFGRVQQAPYGSRRSERDDHTTPMKLHRRRGLLCPTTGISTPFTRVSWGDQSQLERLDDFRYKTARISKCAVFKQPPSFHL